MNIALEFIEKKKVCFSKHYSPYKFFALFCIIAVL